ncbi:hypothetical protein [Teredinibacter sp. KSP-S5-2]|uniref:hypothetical protein n=1 Tax=Teredinibacter sp. KSP-S5-2 TaxID=3034506 RepID=UPI0029340E74|nr:hypothetical protein [Teredinibacter sp. KSP-S5-2]WNO08447.1 hypothetical protein P5V12_15865 [Teredinibacter sp. KSP-S5-2]
MNILFSVVLGVLGQILPIGVGAIFLPGEMALVVTIVLSCAVYSWALNEVVRLEFKKYELPFSGDITLAIVMFVLFNAFALMFFFYSWLLIKQGRALLKSEMPVVEANKKGRDPWRE